VFSGRKRPENTLFILILLGVESYNNAWFFIFFNSGEVTMTISCFADKLHLPDEAELLAALGPAGPLWQRLVSFVEVDLQVPGEWNYGGKNYGWNRWYRKSGRAVASLYPQDAGLVAQVVLGKEQVAQARALAVGPTVERLLRETQTYHDGMWLFIAVHTAEEAGDVEQLLRIKRPAKKARSQAAV
jgi:hypothetical protein